MTAAGKDSAAPKATVATVRAVFDTIRVFIF
jgi:hypothetical protein